MGHGPEMRSGERDHRGPEHGRDPAGPLPLAKTDRHPSRPLDGQALGIQADDETQEVELPDHRRSATAMMQMMPDQTKAVGKPATWASARVGPTGQDSYRWPSAAEHPQLGNSRASHATKTGGVGKGQVKEV